MTGKKNYKAELTRYNMANVIILQLKKTHSHSYLLLELIIMVIIMLETVKTVIHILRIC